MKKNSHSDVIPIDMTKKIHIKQYPKVTLIIDCTEL